MFFVNLFQIGKKLRAEMYVKHTLFVKFYEKYYIKFTKLVIFRYI